MRIAESKNHVNHLGVLSTICRSPKYSFRSRCGIGALDCTESPPGPGNYSIPSTFKPKISNSLSRNGFGWGERNIVGLGIDGPGPGAYILEKPEFVPSRSFSRAHRDVSYIRANSIPGPGAYEKNRPVEKGPSFTLSGRHGGIFDGRSRSVSPSPAAYTIPAKSVTPRWTFSSSKRRGILKDRSTSAIPGPGQYELGRPELLLKKAPCFSMKTRHNRKPDTATNSCGTNYTQFGE